ncbi:tetraspanin-8-like isoform X2 [Archocentrus centrarchus]|uniref:tetraspanin-8-like isoform X2 n=1 Tax=Archocentrus centrarchus TaxID=63155 RepID=UPI0011EA120C|nr:tetraspanin-8-like isoform X2 [Archocentrus centrarchus]
MGTMYIWLKRSYVVVISLIAIIGLLLLGHTLFSHGNMHQQEEVEKELKVIYFMYIVAVVIIALTIFGAFGVWKEKKWALIVFAVGMILSSLSMLVVNITGLVAVPKIAEDVKTQYWDLLNATEVFSAIQTELECCGLEGYQDWEFNIPESCLCTEEPTNPCVAAPRNSSLVNRQKDDLPVMIYEKGCFPYLIEAMMSIIRIVLGVMLGILLLWVLSIVLCIVILCQLDRKKHIPAVAYSAEAKAGNYTTLTELPDHS